MPIYPFDCTKEECNFSVELILKLAEYEKKEYNQNCPECNSVIKRSMNPMHFRLIGSRWYRDGYHSIIDHEQKQLLKEHDGHRKNEEKMSEAMNKAGLY